MFSLTSFFVGMFDVCRVDGSKTSCQLFCRASASVMRVQPLLQTEWRVLWRFVDELSR